jgi:hypothetical protein
VFVGVVHELWHRVTTRGLASPVTDLIDPRHRQANCLGKLLAGDALGESLAN